MIAKFDGLYALDETSDVEKKQLPPLVELCQQQIARARIFFLCKYSSDKEITNYTK